MLKKIRSLTYKYAIPAAFISFILIDLILHGLGKLLSSIAKTLPMLYLAESILIIIPAVIVFIFGFGSTFKKGNFLRGLICCLPFFILQLWVLVVFFIQALSNPETNWQSWYMIVYGLFSIFCVGFREECFYRATLQNIVAKKHANSVKGIWITVGISALLFGLCHVSNLFYGMDPRSVLVQVFYAAVAGLLFGAVYLRSGSIWALIFIHTLTDIAGFAGSTFLKHISDVEELNNMGTNFSWGALVIRLIYIGIAVFLLRPSKCKQICESLCFKGDEPEECAHE